MRAKASREVLEFPDLSGEIFEAISRLQTTYFKYDSEDYKALHISSYDDVDYGTDYILVGYKCSEDGGRIAEFTSISNSIKRPSVFISDIVRYLKEVKAWVDITYALDTPVLIDKWARVDTITLLVRNSDE